MEERLQKYMASCGVASRRNSERMIEAGRVKVNGVTKLELGIKIDPSIDIVEVDGVKINLEKRKVYIILNKPEGYLCTLKDERGRKTVLDLVKTEERIFPIGRLDYDTSGLLIMTNDGEIYNKVIHPREKINKVYEAEISGYPSLEEINRFCGGIDIGGYITAPAHLEIIEKYKENTLVKITIHEGKKRQIRKMCKEINHPVIKLKRISIGQITLGSLEKGHWRLLSGDELEYLNKL